MVSPTEIILRDITLWFLAYINFFRDGMDPFKAVVACFDCSIFLCTTSILLSCPVIQAETGVTASARVIRSVVSINKHKIFG